MGRVRDLWHDRRTGQRTARYGRGRRWLAVWVADGQERSKAFDRKVDAERHLTTVGASLLSGSYVDPAAGRITVRTYAARWLADQVQLRPTTAAWYESHLRNHVLPVLGDVALGAVRRSTVQALVAALSRDLAPGTVRGVFKTLAIVFRAAVRDRLVPAS